MTEKIPADLFGLALRQRAQQELGASFSPQRFHLEFMKQGTIPAGYFGDELLLALKKPPVGPSSGRSARRTAAAAPSGMV